MKKLLSTIIIVFLLSFSTSSAEAHRSGCHRWHSCPSDSGSYVCGDLGYTSECGGAQAPVVVQEEPTVEYTPPTAVPTHKPLPTRKSTPAKAQYIETANDKKKLFKVVRVVDGDTIVVNVRGKDEKVRLLGIDTPETVDPRKPVQCFGKEASNKMKSLVSGKFVRLEDDKQQGNKDKYKRLLRWVYDGDTFINRDMVAQGFATSYKQYPTKHLNDFNNLEKQAREKSLGLWGSCE